MVSISSKTTRFGRKISRNLQLVGIVKNISAQFNLANVEEISHARIENNLEHRKELNGGRYEPYLNRESNELAGTLSYSR